MKKVRLKMKAGYFMALASYLNQLTIDDLRLNDIILDRMCFVSMMELRDDFLNVASRNHYLVKNGSTKHVTLQVPQSNSLLFFRKYNGMLFGSDEFSLAVNEACNQIESQILKKELV